MASVVDDATIVPGGRARVDTLAGDGYAVHWIAEAIKQAKPGAALGAATGLVERTANGSVRVAGDGVRNDRGVITAVDGDGAVPPEFLDALGAHRAWERPAATVPA